MSSDKMTSVERLVEVLCNLYRTDIDSRFMHHNQKR